MVQSKLLYVMVRLPFQSELYLCAFASLQASYAAERLAMVAISILRNAALSLDDLTFVMRQVSNLFDDSDAWPSRRAAYYLGIVPKLVPPTLVSSVMHTRIIQHYHTISIKLAGRI